MSGTKALAGMLDLALDVLVLQRLGEAGREAARVDHVAGEEHLHLAATPSVPSRRDSSPSALRQVLRDPRQAVAAELQRLDQVALRLGDLVRARPGRARGRRSSPDSTRKPFTWFCASTASSGPPEP